ncbi:downstream neighbor of son-like protein [Oryzias melastigma]|uniref:Downstream neighbor of son-like protein n=1 Tax=Oryzias melastigma TaxID=30732 RepID=A0A834CM43_ORYME|nr:downstream neighbor of son-like protein [Oryzias melastigma]
MFSVMSSSQSRSVNVKNQVKSGFQNLSSLEIAGPVLPSSLHAIIGLLRSTQKGNFSASLYTHAPTAVMNVNAFERKDTPVDLSDIGLPSTSVEQLKQPPGLGPSGLTHISMNDYSYSWRS